MVEDRGRNYDRRVKKHIVAKGETLYSIAWRYDIPYQDLADTNNIDATFRIFPGQELSLDTSRRTKKYKKKPPQSAYPSPEQKAKKVEKAKKEKHSVSSKRSKKETPKKQSKIEPSRHSATLVWHWPSKGSLIKKFGDDKGRHKGIDLKGKLGESVTAASAGLVVYAGSGLRGYGKLVIIKHNESHLSAYAHNHRILVSEGDNVGLGQKVAEMGSSGTDMVKLHFEIRLNGQPVDPMKYLPLRSD